MQILGLFGMYFDDVVVKVKTFLLLFRLALAILCTVNRTCMRCSKSKTIQELLDYLAYAHAMFTL